MPKIARSLGFIVRRRKTTHYQLPTSHSKGFTIIELLVVIAIIGILVVVASMAYGNVRQKARDSQRKEELKALKAVLLMYYQDHDAYPDPGADLMSDSTEGVNWIPGLVPDYIKSLPKDPNQAGLFPMLANIFKKQRLNEGQPQPQVAAAGSVDVRVNSGTDDAEQRLDTNAIDISSSDLELTQDPASSNQEVGMRFTIVNIPVGATITNAYIEFETDETTSGATNLTVWGEANDSPAAFSTATSNITSRTKTSASVAWSNVPAWTIISEKHQTPNLSSVIQQIVSRPGWASGNSIVIIITGSGSRVAEAYEGEPANAPLLHVDYTTGASSPAVTTTAASSVTSTGASLNGSANPNGQSTTGWFRFSTTNPGTCNDTFGTRAPSTGGTSLGTGTSSVVYAQSISGLATSTTYYFCAIASNATGTGTGTVLSFTTGAPPLPAPACSPASQSVQTGVAANLSASGGDGTYSWSAAGGTPSSGSGSGFSVTYSTASTYSITVTSNSQTSTPCTVTVTAAPPPSSSSNIYNYVVAADQKSFVLWAVLEKSNDPEALGGSSATCSQTPPDTKYNYCIESPQ